eukprot:TRINITY_DN1565_c0_g1_i1.p2 TRINITY_DN1565_c0_g1~~TRINITY_DN1565_c0_g1_i1.p2  ORF type:complete len:160 (+),score=14.00 TRINITY_DN1565_c0_g1_i1:27-506(+)
MLRAVGLVLRAVKPSSLPKSRPAAYNETSKVASEALSGEDHCFSESTGIPEEQYATRKARIYQPSANAMSSGKFKYGVWKISFSPDVNGKWANPLMGWTSSADPLSMMHLTFTSPEEAVEYAKRAGWQYEIERPHDILRKGKNYGDNFKWQKPPRTVDF